MASSTLRTVLPTSFEVLVGAVGHRIDDLFRIEAFVARLRIGNDGGKTMTHQQTAYEDWLTELRKTSHLPRLAAVCLAFAFAIGSQDVAPAP